MREKQTAPSRASDLRQRAEAISRRKAADASENLETLSPEAVRQLLHELRVHQIQLEMQNEELRRAQEKLEASRAQYFDLYDLAPVGYFTISKEGLILQANLTGTNLLGMQRSALLKQPFSRFIVKEDQDIYYLHRRGLFETQAPQVCELRLVRRGSSIIWVRLEATVAQDDERGAPVCRAVISDITERKRVEEAEAQRNHELTALHHALVAITQTLDLREVLDEIVSQVGTAIGSTYASIATINQDGSFGMISDDLPGVPPLNRRIRPQGVTRRVIAAGQPAVIEDVAAETDTNPFLVAAGVRSYAGLPLKAKDTIIGVLLVHSREPKAFGNKMRLLADFANQAAIAIENARLYREAALVASLRETDRLKNELLANVSHELRTPLASIKGYNSYVIHYFDRLSKSEMLDSLKEIDGASDKLSEMVENLLQVTRLEAGGFPLQKEPVQIGPVIEQVAADMAQRVSSRRFVTHPVDMAVAVECDPGRIRQVIDNLLGNAGRTTASALPGTTWRRSSTASTRSNRGWPGRASGLAWASRSARA
ncbi:MAG: GAF domain-containing protein [Chloroflexi bacterium]|nr:GAF domain-containing protein [Chloroflexota bacterium]